MRIASSDSASFDELEHEVVLLQTTAEVKKGKSSTAIDQEVTTAEAEYKVSCPTTTVNSGAEKFKADQRTFEQPLVPTMVATEESSSREHTATIESASEFRILPTICMLLLGFACAAGMQSVSQKRPSVKKARGGAVAESAPSTSQEFTELLQAAAAGNFALYKTAVGQCSDLHKLDSWGCTVLHYAAKGGSVDITRCLLDRGLQVNATEVWDETPLHIAARAGHKDVCELLINEGADMDALNAQDWTPLIVAGHEKKQDVCSFLFSQGAGVAGLADSELPSMISLMIAQQVLMKAAGMDCQ